MTRWLVVLAACGGSSEPAAPSVGSAPAPDTISAQLVGCSAALAPPQDPRDDANTALPWRTSTRLVREWTPFASEPPPAAELARPVVDAVSAVVRERVRSVDHCFDGTRGAIRALIAIDGSGRIKQLRVGGSGDRTIDTCIATALAGFTVALPAEPVDVACDFTRGGDAPLRVAVDGGYNVIELTTTEARNRSSVRAIPPRGEHRSVTMLGSSSAVLVVAEPDAPAHGLEYALWWAPAGTTLVAVKASGGAPIFVGMGDSRAQRVATTDRRLLQLRTDGGKLRACIGATALPETAQLLDPRAMDRVLAAAATACKQAPCEPTVVVGTSGTFVAKDLVATTSAARRAGLHQLIIGGPACD